MICCKESLLRSMRLCLVSLDIAPVRTSGLAVYAERTAARLAAAGHDVTVIAALRPGTLPVEELGAVHVRRVPIDRSDWIGYGWRAARYVRRLNRQEPFDVVHFIDLHFAWAYSGRYVASLLQSFRQRLTADRGRPYASSWRNRVFRTLYYRTARRVMEQPALRRADACVALSHATRDEFVQHYHLEPARVRIIPEPIDCAHFSPRPTDELRRLLGLEGARVLLYVGFSTPRKGLEYLVAGLHALPQDVRLVIVGTWEPGYRDKVIAAAGFAWERVIETGAVTDEAIPVYLSLADIFVLPSLLEGFGIPVLEAMACGTPVVATTAGSIGEVVGSCGLLVAPGDTSAMVEAINRLLDDDDLRHRLGHAARERAVSTFGEVAVVAQLVEVYEAHRAAIHGSAVVKAG
jgi:glycosyltransferase involved in cell wall biosynthesis